MLVGDYDAWRWEFKEETAEFYQGLQMRDHGPFATVWDDLRTDKHYGTIAELRRDGRIIRRYRDQFAKNYGAQFGFYTVFEGHKAYAVNIGRPSPTKEFFDAIGVDDDTEILIPFAFDGKQFTVSLYDNGDDSIHLGELAQKYGGGGHRGAAGFQCDSLPFCRAGSD